MRKAKIKINITFALLVLMALSAVTVFAEDIKFEASIDKNVVAIGDAAQMALIFYGTQEAPAPDVGTIDGLEIRYMGPSTMMTVINGRISTSVTHVYRIMPLKVGKFDLGPFSFNYRGNRYVSNAVSLNVVEERLPQPISQTQAAPTTSDLNIKDRIYLILTADKTTAYVNELVPVSVKLYVNRLNVTDIQLPSFGQEGFSKVEFKEPRQSREYIRGEIFDVLEFKTAIFGTKPGTYTLGPAKLKCNLVVRKRTNRRGAAPTPDDFFGDDSGNPWVDDFFVRTERIPTEVKSADTPLVILPLPQEGKPQDFSGAVGDYQFIYNVNPKKVKAGDPVTLTMEINGTGNFNTVLMPKLGSTDNFKVYEPQVKTEDNRKSFTQVLIPESETVTQVPRAEFNYFDPKKKIYKSITQGPVPLQVEKGKDEAPAQVVGPTIQATADMGVPEEEPKRNIIYIKESPGTLRADSFRIYKNRAFIFFAPIPLLALLVFSVFWAREDRFRHDRRYAGRVRALKAAKEGRKAVHQQLKKSDVAGLYEAIFKTLQEYLGNRLNRPPAGVTYSTIEETLKQKNVDEKTLEILRNLFEMCDNARFGFSRADDFRIHNDAKILEDMIKYFERFKL